MLDFEDINNAVNSAEIEIARVQNSARDLGTLAERPMILRNMRGQQLENIKRQLKDFNMATWRWKD